MNNHLLLTLKASSVLLVDYNKTDREKISNLLSSYIGKIYEASNGIEGLEIYKNCLPSFIISDIEMPTMNGLTFIKEIRKLDNSVPVIIVSELASKKILLEAIKLSLINYLQKPVYYEQLSMSLLKVAELLNTIKLFGEIKIKENCIYDSTNKRLILDKTYYYLSKSEICVLELLILNKCMIVTKEMINAKNNFLEGKSTSFYYHLIHNLRRKIGKDLIINISKSGYMLVY